MLKLIGMNNCKVCKESKKILEDHNVKYEFANISEDESAMDLAKRFKIQVAGKFLYDDEKDDIISVSDYISSLG